MQRPNDPIAARALFVKNLNFNITGNDLYDLFGKYGPIRQIRLGTDTQLKTKGTAYIVYESPDDAKEAMNHLNGFHLMERYIVVLYHHPSKQQASALAKAEIRAREQAVALEKQRLGLRDDQ
ncbi:hypothetical protein DB88DRAFT_490855 [Papiliotrema laurentii]|uniref:RRM domain-containing protein n=1 Tax=Papiliotrema laurentii TaxID=5418 RepID=A0AAD9FPB6_PAPLA|nr:hypothetical protein DB88DRAFT_490855 [Papiliotrema laurentii]